MRQQQLEKAIEDMIKIASEQPANQWETDRESASKLARIEAILYKVQRK